MTGGPPILEIGSESALGFVLQPTFGTPVVVPANALNWIEWTARSLKYTTGRKLVKTGAGTRSDTRKRRRAKAMSSGTFTIPLQQTQGMLLLAAFFGKDTITGTNPYLHTFDNTVAPSLLTLQVIRSGQAYQYQDVMLADVTLALGGDDQWELTFTIMGGNGGTEVATATPTFATDFNELTLSDLTAVTLLGSVPVDAVTHASIKVSNTPKQGWGGGSVHPTRIHAGEWTCAGDLTTFFDSAAEATAFQSSIAGTEVTQVYTIGTHVITLPNSNILDHDWTDNLADLGVVKANFEVRNPGGITWAVTNAVTPAYI